MTGIFELTEKVIDSYHLKKTPGEWYDDSGYIYELPCGYPLFFITMECKIGEGCKKINSTWLSFYLHKHGFFITSKKELEGFMKLSLDELHNILEKPWDEINKFIESLNL